MGFLYSTLRSESDEGESRKLDSNPGLKLNEQTTKLLPKLLPKVLLTYLKHMKRIK